MFMQYDPANFGTPLSILQIPAKAIQRVQEKLSDPDCTLTRYTQDCRHFVDLRKLVSPDDFAVARRASLDVGYICRRCQIVYPVAMLRLTPGHPLLQGHGRASGR